MTSLEEIIKVCRESESLGWKSFDFFARNESDADNVEKMLKNIQEYEYTRRKTNFEIKRKPLNTFQNIQETHESQEQRDYEILLAQMASFFGY
jgi:hypothetical protein